MLLGPEVCPRVLFLGTDFYAMEHLRPMSLSPELPLAMEYMLSELVWSRDPIDVRGDWPTQLHETTGISAPYWTFEGEHCLTHGDPTLANLMARDKGGEMQHLVLCDPVPPGRRVPQIREIDQAKIVQSMMGWEAMIGGLTLRNYTPILDERWQEPDFLVHANELSARRLMFWIGISMIRCQQHLDTAVDGQAFEWCEHIKRETLRAAGV